MKHLLPIALAWLTAGASAAAVEVTLHHRAEGQPISPLIYGSNHDLNNHVVNAARRLGGNRLSAYNWEIDASNAGKDFRHDSDRWLSEQTWWRDTAASDDAPPPGAPAATIHRFHRESVARGSYSLVTVPLAGYVVADADGPVSASETAPSPRWVASGDGSALIQHLVDTHGPAGAARSVKGYSLGNEPALWHSTHPRMRPQTVTCADLLGRSVLAARAVKRIDADADVFGPALWGMTAYASLSGADDWPALKKHGGFNWFIDAYLDHMRRASEQAGQRLLDVLDVHWYTEAPADRDWLGDEAARAAKALYDPKHTEPNWVGKHFSRFLPLLPRLRESIDRHYPGTKTGITEYDWPQTGTVYGGLAQADALGAFGRWGVYFAAYHHYAYQKPDRYVGAAFRLFRNYDGAGSAFADRTVPVTLSGPAPDLDVYASRDADTRTVHAIVVCRSATEPIDVVLQLDAGPADLHARSWFFDAEHPEVTAGPAPKVQPDGRVTFTVAPLSAWHVVLALPQP